MKRSSRRSPKKKGAHQHEISNDGLENFYAITQFYEPFILGGDVWKWVRYQIRAKRVNLINKFEGFVFYCELTDEYQVHEASSGGLLGHAKGETEAIFIANRNISITPDLRKQVNRIIQDSAYCETVLAQEARRRIARSSNRKEKAAEEERLQKEANKGFRAIVLDDVSRGLDDEHEDPTGSA